MRRGGRAPAGGRLPPPNRMSGTFPQSITINSAAGTAPLTVSLSGTPIIAANSSGGLAFTTAASQDIALTPGSGGAVVLPGLTMLAGLATVSSETVTLVQTDGAGPYWAPLATYTKTTGAVLALLQCSGPSSAVSIRQAAKRSGADASYAASVDVPDEAGNSVVLGWDTAGPYVQMYPSADVSGISVTVALLGI